MILKPNSEVPDQTPHYAVSDLDLHCLPMSHKKEASLIWDTKGYSMLTCRAILDV